MTTDVFISYNSDDVDLVKELGKNLKTRGLIVWLDIWEIKPGTSFMKSLEDVIDKANSMLIVVGASGIGPWQNEEMEACIRQFVERQMPVIPVLLANAKEKPKLPLFLRGLTWVDFRTGSENECLTRIEWGITGRKPQTYQNLVSPLYQHERDFLQVLLQKFSLLRSNTGFKLEIYFDHKTPTISKRAARRFLRQNITKFDAKVKEYEDKLNTFIVQEKGEACNIEDSDFMFRYASGGTLPILKINNIDYYCLFFRGIHPIGWNIANGGCNTLEELLNPVDTIKRELREELIIVDKKNWYFFEGGIDIKYDRPEFEIARKFWDRKFDQLGHRRFKQLNIQPIKLKFLSGPDQLCLKYSDAPLIKHNEIFVTITAEDFGIEIDKVATIDMSKNEDIILCDGEINDLYSVNRPIGLFRVDDFSPNNEPVIPEIFFYSGSRYKGIEFIKIIETEILKNIKDSGKFQNEILEEFEKSVKRNNFKLCPVSNQLIMRHQKLLNCQTRTQRENC